MKKKLFTLLVCVFAVVSANAWTVSFSTDENGTVATITSENPNSDNWSDIKYPEGVTNGADQLLAAKTLKFIATDATKITSLQAFQSGGFAATTVDFSGAVFTETEGTPITYQGWNPSPTGHYESMSVTPTTNAMTFSYFKNCQNAILAKVRSICHGCFTGIDAMKLGSGTFTIPETVEYIADFAVENTPISSIEIPANVKYIAYQAFQNAEIKALIDVTVKGYTFAANGAFDKQTTVGQTDADYPAYATLHFPEGAEEYFQNQNDPLTQAISLNKGKFQAWLNSHYETAATGTNPNGWREFMNSGGGDPIPVPGTNKVVLRTFSDNVARLVPLNFRAYLVTGLKEHKDGYAVELVQIFAIPANTGVILYGEVPAKDDGYTLSHISAWDDTPANRTANTYVAPYNRKSTSAIDAENNNVTITNYMVPTVEQTILYPTYKNSSIWDAAWPLSGDMKQYTTGTEVTDRNFILADFCDTSLKEAKGLNVNSEKNYVGFFRVKANVKCGPNKAYLSLPKSLYASAEGAEAIVVKPQAPPSMVFRSAVWNDPTSTGNWGQRGNLGTLHAKFAGFEEEVTGISYVNAETVSDNSYYTLEGVKVAHPQKGVYVKNGKKIIK